MEILVAVLILVAAAGTVVPILPGALLAGGAIGVWAVANEVWWLAVLAAVLTTVAVVLKLVIPARTARDSASSAALAMGAVLGVLGMVYIPVVGLPLGFLAGVLLAELVRLRDLSAAWAATRAALKSIGVSMVVELTAVVLMAAAWVVALVVR